MRSRPKPSFVLWLKHAFILIGKQPVIWLGYAAFMYFPLAAGRVSLALGIFFAVTGLFAGVAVAEYIDIGREGERRQGMMQSVSASLPLAMSMAALIVIGWFAFRVIYNFYSGEPEKILQFLFYWELTAENFADKDIRQLAVWIYRPAIAALIFALLMFISFVSWFSFPLMAFKQLDWVEAKRLGREADSACGGAQLQLIGFVLLLALAGTGAFPLVTPFIFFLISTLMYVSYRSVFRQPQQ
ncbi:MAG: hypothetical protein ACU833_02875 [Gammaproteobacteria bacterium]